MISLYTCHIRVLQHETDVYRLFLLTHPDSRAADEHKTSTRRAADEQETNSRWRRVRVMDEHETST